MKLHTRTEAITTDCYNVSDEIKEICHGDRTLMRVLLMTMRGYRLSEIQNALHCTKARVHMLKNQIRSNYMRGLAG